MIRGAFQTSVSEDEPDRPSRERDGSINSQQGALPRQTVDVAKFRIDSPRCRPKARTGSRPKANLGQKEAKQQELSEEQFSHMKGGKAAKSLQQKKGKEQSK